MKDYSNILTQIKDSIYLNQKTKDENHFFFSSLLHFAISLEVGINTFKNTLISYEKICIIIPKRLGSRSTIQSILNEAVALGYFEKITSSQDKRVKNYKLSIGYTKMIENWTQDQKKIFSDNLINKVA